MGTGFRFGKDAVQIVSILNATADRWQRNTGMDLHNLSGVIGRTYDWLSKVLETKLHFHADAIGPLTKATGDTELIEAICRQCGGTFVQDAAVKPLRAPDIRIVLHHAHGVVDRYLGALEGDGVVDETEATQFVLPAVDRAIQSLHEFRATVKQNAAQSRVSHAARM